MPNSVVVTGSSGRVGTAVAEALAAAGWTVHGVDKVPGRWTTVVGSLEVPSVRRGADVLVHAAALHAPHVGVVPDADFRAVNVDATAALLGESFQRVVYISSTSVYGHSLVPTNRAVWVDETLNPRPRDIYDETKLAAEQLVAAAPVPSITLRIARCFPEPLPVLASHLLHRAVGLNDVAAATVLAVNRSEVTGTYNIAGRYPFTRADCPALLSDAPSLIREKAPEVAAAFKTRGWDLPQQIDRVYDSTAAHEALGYRPTYGVLDLL